MQLEAKYSIIHYVAFFWSFRPGHVAGRGSQHIHSHASHLTRPLRLLSQGIQVRISTYFISLKKHEVFFSSNFLPKLHLLLCLCYFYLTRPPRGGRTSEMKERDMAASLRHVCPSSSSPGTGRTSLGTRRGASFQVSLPFPWYIKKTS